MSSGLQDWVPRGIDTTTPSTARMYDYYLGGKDNYEVDRQAAEQVFQSVPETPELARHNRAFLQRAVRFLAGEAGIRQFLDIGTGLPTQGNVHEIAHEIAPEARVAYVDNDPIVLTHARALLEDATPNVTVLEADMRQPEEILAGAREFLDFTEPVAVLLVSVLHFATDDDNPASIIARLNEHLVPGSYLVLSHVTGAPRPDDAAEGAQVYRSATSPVTLRTPDQIGALFDGFTLVAPGLTPAARWRPETEPDNDPIAGVYLAGIGQKNSGPKM